MYLKESATKAISVEKLIAILKDMPKDLVILPNSVGNLLVLDASGNDYIGYIDLADESFEDITKEES